MSGSDSQPEQDSSRPSMMLGQNSRHSAAQWYSSLLPSEPPATISAAAPPEVARSKAACLRVRA